MRKADLPNNHQSFDDSLQRYRAFMDKIVKAQRVVASSADKRDLAESVLLLSRLSWKWRTAFRR